MLYQHSFRFSFVAPGTYNETLNFNGKAITVTSSGGPKVTIIDGGNLGAVVTFTTGETNASVLSGFTIQHGNNSGVYLDLERNLGTDGTYPSFESKMGNALMIPNQNQQRYAAILVSSDIFLAWLVYRGWLSL